MISIENLRFTYGEPEVGPYALDGIDLTIGDEEFVAILGHNGSGKSTLAKLLNGLLIPTEGRILVDGMDTKDDEKIWDIRSRAGMVFQNPDNQMVATIVEEEVAFGPENLGVPMPELRQRVDRALEVVGMESFKRHAPHLLSGGQKQRVAIAGILAMGPKIIIMDESTAMLDPRGRREVMDTVMRLAKEEHKTVIIITHYMEEAAMADRLVVLDKGKVIIDDTPRRVFSQVEKIKSIGLDVPQATELSHLLKEEGLKIDTEILTDDELVEELCRILS